MLDFFDTFNYCESKAFDFCQFDDCLTIIASTFLYTVHQRRRTFRFHYQWMVAQREKQRQYTKLWYPLSIVASIHRSIHPSPDIQFEEIVQLGCRSWSVFPSTDSLIDIRMPCCCVITLLTFLGNVQLLETRRRGPLVLGGEKARCEGDEWLSGH